MIGKSLAHYEVLELVGKGGMGEVYRARDTKLGREVALKILPRELSGDPERAARFEREARALASLHHPNIASIFGFEEDGGVRFLVMELVPGVTLEERMAKGRIPLDEVQNLARKMAAGLEAAHDKGIVHRDLKPANVMITPDGEVKILDFGLARAWFGEGTGDQEMGASPTITAAMTQVGTILGTAAYMSPEQARGRNVDRRADIWAFGVILWEMVTGTTLFEGETISDTLAAVLRAEPDWEKLPVDEAPFVCRLVERCLVRDPRQRLRDIGEARILLQEGGAQASHLSISGVTLGALPAAASAPVRSKWPLLAGTGALGLILGALLGWKLLASAPERPVLHTMIQPPRGTEFDLSGGSPGPAVVSPDARMIAFTARDTAGVTRLYVRNLDREESVSLSGTNGAAYPFWSPDSRFIGFFTPDAGPNDQKLKKIAVNGGPPVSLCVAVNGKGGSWNQDGIIIFAPAHNTPIFRVPSIGGEPVAVTKLGEGEDSHRHPRFLPNGRDFLYLARTTESSKIHAIYVGSLDGGEPHKVTESECQAEYAAGHLLTVRDGVLMSTRFDLGKRQLEGGGTPLVENLLIATSGAAAGSYSVAPSGMMTYQTGVAETERTLQWVTIAGEGVTTVGTKGQIHTPRISPDGTRCVVEVRGESQEGVDLWLVDLGTGLRTRFTFDEGDETSSVWSPDGKSIFYTSHDKDKDTYRIVQQPVEGVGGATILFETQDQVGTSSVHPDGSALLLTRKGAQGTYDIQRLPLTGDGEPQDVLATAQDEAGGTYSPDGRWIAYFATANSGSTWDVFVMPAMGGPRKWQVTTNGTVYPQWKSDGTELFVSEFNGTVTAYRVNIHGDSFEVGSSRRVAQTEALTQRGVEYSIHPDGQRILRAGVDPATKGEVSLVHLVTDWQRGLGR